MSKGDFAFTKLIVGDLERSASFYCDTFGLKEDRRIDAEVMGRKITEIIMVPAAPGAATLVLFAFHDQPEPVVGDSILGFATSDIEALIERALRAGGSVAQTMQSMPEHGAKVGFIRDNEGHLIEVLERF